jgi:hypothetical protein
MVTKADLSTDVKKVRDDLREAIRDFQTEILRGFEAVIRTTEARLQRIELQFETMAGSRALLNNRVSAVENRLFEIKKNC